MLGSRYPDGENIFGGALHRLALLALQLHFCPGVILSDQRERRISPISSEQAWRKARFFDAPRRRMTIAVVVLLGIVLTIAVVSCTEPPATVTCASATPLALPGPTTSPTPTFVPTGLSSPTPTLRPTIEGPSTHTIQLQSRQFTPEADIESGLGWLQTVPDSRVHVILQLYDPPDSTVKEQLEKSGIQLMGYIPNNAWFASIPRALQIDDPAIPLIRWFGPILPEDKVPAELLEGSIGSWALRQRDRIALDVSFFEDMNLQDGEDIICKHNGTVTGSIPMSNKLTVEVPKDVILLLAAEDSVRWIDLIPPPPTTHPEGG